MIIDSMDTSVTDLGEFDDDAFYDDTLDVVYIMIIMAAVALVAGYIGALILTKVAF